MKKSELSVVMTDMNEIESLRSLPPHASVWFFGASRELRENEIATLEAALAGFIRTWSSHKVPLEGKAAVIHRRFVAVAVDPTQKDASGCSIDKLYTFMRKSGEEFGVDFLDSARVYWRDDLGVVHGTTRGEFRQLAASKLIDERTVVFDLSVSTVAELDRWETTAGASWHSQMLAVSA